MHWFLLCWAIYFLFTLPCRSIPLMAEFMQRCPFKSCMSLVSISWAINSIESLPLHSPGFCRTPWWKLAIVLASLLLGFNLVLALQIPSFHITPLILLLSYIVSSVVWLRLSRTKILFNRLLTCDICVGIQTSINHKCTALWIFTNFWISTSIYLQTKQTNKNHQQ